MDSWLTHCPQCGAELKKARDGSNPAHCAYCGIPLPVKALPGKPFQVPAQPLRSGRDFADAPAQGLPPEFRRLNRPKVSPSLESSGCSLVFGLFWTLFSAIFVVVGLGFYISGLQEYNRLTREGIPAPATITELEIDDSGDSTSYYAYYQYRARVQGDLARFEDHDSVSGSFYRSLQVGQQVEILYAKSDPALTAIKAEFEPPSLLFSLIFSGMGGLFVLIGLALMYGALKAQAQLRALRDRGRQAQAFVFDCWKDKDSDGDDTYFIAFAFRVDFQTITRAEQNKALYEKYQVGDSLTVRYLPDDPFVCQVRMER